MLHDDYRELGARVAEALPPLAIQAMFLPPPFTDDTRDDCFGFLFLDDGSAGPFYVSLGDTLAALHSRYPDGQFPGVSTATLLEGFISDNHAERALALGAFNALSQGLMRRAGYRPPPASRDAEPGAGDIIGMVGFFGRLARPWSERGVRVKVLEMAPERVAPLPGVSLATDAAELAGCDRVICTSSTLVNGTLDDIIAAVGDPGKIELVGPSGSGLPDVPLERGVRSVGGMYFDDAKALQAALASTGQWGKAGQKYVLDRNNYPLVDALIRKL